MYQLFTSAYNLLHSKRPKKVADQISESDDDIIMRFNDEENHFPYFPSLFILILCDNLPRSSWRKRTVKLSEIFFITSPLLFLCFSSHSTTDPKFVAHYCQQERGHVECSTETIRESNFAWLFFLSNSLRHKSVFWNMLDQREAIACRV